MAMDNDTYKSIKVRPSTHQNLRVLAANLDDVELRDLVDALVIAGAAEYGIKLPNGASGEMPKVKRGPLTRTMAHDER